MKLNATEFAAKINAHLSAGGAVMVCTHLRSTVYRAKHAGMFSAADNGDLRVRHGRGSVCLGTAKLGLMVAVRFSAEVA